MPYKSHVISTQNEKLTPGSGFRTPTRPNHDGMDFTDANGLQLKQDVRILAFEDGVVVFAGMSSASAGMGNYIDIRHEFGGKKYLTRYCHFKSASPFKAGQTVTKGDIIGVMGTTGNSTGIHLHFGLKEDSVSWNTGTWVNPEPYLTGEKFMRVSEPIKAIDSAIKVGDKVKVINAVTYEGKSFRAWFDKYDVLQVNGDRVVIGVGGIVTAAVRIGDVKKV